MKIEFEERFWTCCAELGISSKRLRIQETTIPTSPITVAVDESVRHGAPVITVPYSAVLNCQTLRGDVVPRALPPYAQARRFLMRRGRMGHVTAQSLWLAALMASYWREKRGDAVLATLLSPAIYPPLPSLFTREHSIHCPFIGSQQSETQLAQWQSLAEGQVHLIRAMMQYYGKQHGVPKALCPSVDELSSAYRSVMQRSLLLPLGCEPSAPAELSELLDSTNLPVLPSLIPVIDLVLPTTPQANQGELEEKSSSGNCAMYTCLASQFTSAATRRRMIVDTSPTSSRRVMLCATQDLKVGDSLKLEFE